MKEGRPAAVATSELANLLVHSMEELRNAKATDEGLWFCTSETRRFIAEFVCKDIASSVKARDEFSELQGESVNQGYSKRKRERKFDSKLEMLYKQACVGVSSLNEQRNYGIHLKHDVSDYLN